MTDLPPMPEAKTEEPQLKPGGVDAIEDKPEEPGLSRDLHPAKNPAVENVLPPELAVADDKTQAPDGTADEEAGTTSDPKGDDSPSAGQVAEDGTPEPPA